MKERFIIVRQLNSDNKWETVTEYLTPEAAGDALARCERYAACRDGNFDLNHIYEEDNLE